MTKRFLFGEWGEDSKPLTAGDVEEICRRASEAQNAMSAYPVDKILDLLDRVRRVWMNPDSIYRREAQEILPEATGFSPEMIRMGLDELGNLLDPEILQKKIRTEMRSIPRGLDLKYEEATKTSLRWHPVGSLLHVLSGNVFLVGPGSLIEGLLTGNVNILKMPSSETYFLPRFIASLMECDRDGIVSRSLAVLEYSSGQKDVIETFKRNVDGVIVWGGEEAVQTYRAGLPSRTRLVIFGPKLSFAVITGSYLEKNGAREAAALLARELAVWDQNACTAPQVCFVENKRQAQTLFEALPSAMDQISEMLPPGAPDPNSAVDIHQLRSVFEVAQSRGERQVRGSKRGVDWTVLLDPQSGLEPSPLNRTIRIVPLDDLEDVFPRIAPMKNYLQTVGLLAAPHELITLSRRLAEAGALKIARLGEMSGGEVDDPHDGAYDLPQLMNLVVGQWTPPEKGMMPLEMSPAAERKCLQEQKFRTMIRSARRAPFYAERLQGRELNVLDDLVGVPPLTREEWETCMIPKSDVLATRASGGGYVTRSGGSTGDPKFSFFDEADWDAMCLHAVSVFRACGLEKGDRLANFMLAGDLYGSFISFNHVNFLLGVTSFAFAGEYTPESFLDIWKKFRINAIQGIPTVFMTLLRRCKEIEPAFSLEKVMYAGLPMSPADRQWLKESCGVKRIASVIGTTEAGQLAFQCGHLSGAFHHVADDYNHIELVDENGRPVAPGTKGRIAVTTLMKHNFPLIRYLIGDAARWVEKPCDCGRTAPVLEYLGRWDDILSIGLCNLRYGEVRGALEGFPISELQMTGRFEDRLEVLGVKAEVAGLNGGELERMTQDIHRVLFERFPTFPEQESQGILRVEVEVVPPGRLPRNSRSGKVKAIVDDRPQTAHTSK